jgi:hypothetical protein
MAAEARESSRIATGALGAPGPHDEVRTALARLETDGFIVASGETWRTSRRWQQAMARAAAKLYEAGDPGEDLRVPIALAMVDAYSGRADDETVAELVEAMLPIEVASLGLVSWLGTHEGGKVQ